MCGSKPSKFKEKRVSWKILVMSFSHLENIGKQHQECSIRIISKYTRMKKKCRVTYKDSFKGYNVILPYILKPIIIG